MEFEAGLGTRVALDMELYIGVLESFGTDKYKHWYEKRVESLYNIFILGGIGESSY